MGEEYTIDNIKCYRANGDGTYTKIDLGDSVEGWELSNLITNGDFDIDNNWIIETEKPRQVGISIRGTKDYVVQESSEWKIIDDKSEQHNILESVKPNIIFID